MKRCTYFVRELTSPVCFCLLVERKGRCEICAKDVGDLLKHNASVGHQMRQAEKEGVELPMYTCQVSTCGKSFLR